MITSLNLEVKRLASLISEKTPDCQVGVWCKECKHLGTDYAGISRKTMMPSHWGTGERIVKYVADVQGQVYFCKKHLHEICPEFDDVNSSNHIAEVRDTRVDTTKCVEVVVKEE